MHRCNKESDHKSCDKIRFEKSKRCAVQKTLFDLTCVNSIKVTSSKEQVSSIVMTNDVFSCYIGIFYPTLAINSIYGLSLHIVKTPVLIGLTAF
ncbi:hypothetical protein L596_030801 [Steinernema carpocapsae]|uniref:Uncharacterized protein n=1 Tax=Steinernema carpocapsae TaxID=34508 RepID=A0A4U5LNT0_STECR|nr:hypothetical protein L596_030801 [Steinernema carpocapsae]